MKKLLYIFTLALFSTTNFAHSEAITGDVKGGQKTLIYNYSKYDPTRCSGMALPKLGTVKTENGKITTRISTQKLDKGSCKGRVIKSLEVFYTPNRGFKGKDKVSVILTSSRYVDGTGHTSTKLKYNLNVK